MFNLHIVVRIICRTAKNVFTFLDTFDIYLVDDYPMFVSNLEYPDTCRYSRNYRIIKKPDRVPLYVISAICDTMHLRRKTRLSRKSERFAVHGVYDVANVVLADH